MRPWQSRMGSVNCKLALAIRRRVKLRPDDIDTQVYSSRLHLCASDMPPPSPDTPPLLDKAPPTADVYAMSGRSASKPAIAAGDVTTERASPPCQSSNRLRPVGPLIRAQQCRQPLTPARRDRVMIASDTTYAGPRSQL